MFGVLVMTWLVCGNPQNIPCSRRNIPFRNASRLLKNFYIMWLSLIGTWFALWLTVTLGVALGRIRWLIISRSTVFRLMPIVMLSTLVMGFPASNELCNGSRELKASYEVSEWFTTIPATLFGALSLQAMAQLAMASASNSQRQLFVAPCVIVHLCTCIYYLFGETLASSCVLATRWGSELRPLHYVLWWVSMSAQMLTLMASS